MPDPVGKLVTLVAEDEDGVLHALLVDDTGRLIVKR